MALKPVVGFQGVAPIHQKRLIPLLHLDGVKNMQDANKYLENYVIERFLNNDWTFSYNGKIYQLPRQSKYPPARKKISLKITISDKIFVTYRDPSFSLF